MRTLRRLMVAGVALAMTAAAVGAQRRSNRIFIEPNVAYDGRFTFVRLSYTVYNRSGWEFDYPAMERNFMTIANDLTTLHPHVRQSNVHRMDDPKLSHYPISYLSEPGYWLPDAREAAGLRDWIAKGGFLIVDDFYLREWANFDRSMHLVMPDARIVPIPLSHPIFNAFFHITTLDGMTHPDNASAHAQYLGIFENNDPTKRLQVIINYNNDIGDYMEWSGGGYYPVNMSNDAYKFATNYVVYALTH